MGRGRLRNGIEWIPPPEKGENSSFSSSLLNHVQQHLLPGPHTEVGTVNTVSALRLHIRSQNLQHSVRVWVLSLSLRSEFLQQGDPAAAPGTDVQLGFGST